MASCDELARTAGVHNLVLSVISNNAAAHRLYTRLGFTREPGRDFSPTADVSLEVYTRPVL
jgi:RimJ/RimL family protein N-acetyltransferase